MNLVDLKGDLTVLKCRLGRVKLYKSMHDVINIFKCSFFSFEPSKLRKFRISLDDK